MAKRADGSYHPYDVGLLHDHFPELDNLPANIKVHSFEPAMDSSNVGPEVWTKLAKLIHDRYNSYDGFVILHGSDTMAYTGSALSFMIEGLRKPVILTGSQLPIGEIRTDAKENLITAIEIAALPEAPAKEVCIYFEYQLNRANRTHKAYADTFAAFIAPNFRPIAEAGVRLKFYRPTPADAYLNVPFRVQEKLETRIASVKFFPGIQESILQNIILNEDSKGVIIETFGAGNVQTDQNLVGCIKEAVDKGKVVVNITQCMSGTVDMGKYATSKHLKEFGVLSGGDMTYEAALTKMMYLMGKYDDPEKVKYFIPRNIRGEMTAERAYTL